MSAPFEFPRKPFLSRPSVSSSSSLRSPERPQRFVPALVSSTVVQTMPSAPILDELSPLPGYETATSVSTVVQPPPCYLPPSVDSALLNPFHIPNISTSEARSLVRAHVRSKFCWNKKAAEELVINHITMKPSYHYHLNTFTEKRETAWKYEPSLSDPYPWSSNQAAPRPWDVSVTPDPYFVDGSKKLEVPHTSTIRRCDDCLACGQINCSSCFGQGSGVCFFCSGVGIRTGETAASGRCLQCSGSGRVKCHQCNGSGKVSCTKCNGSCYLRWYVELTVSWKNYQENFISTTSGLKPKHISKVKGIKCFLEEAIILQPLINFPDTNIANASVMLVERQLKAHPHEKIIRQKHHVRVIPVALVNYTWKGKSSTFHIYGSSDERTVHFKKYPQRCCCCTMCSIC